MLDLQAAFVKFCVRLPKVKLIHPFQLSRNLTQTDNCDKDVNSGVRSLKMYHLEISAQSPDNNEPRSVLEEEKQTAKNTENDNDDLHFNFNVPRPLGHNRSVPSFLDERLQYLQVDEGRRSRSHSEPLTREAVKIAQELRKVSDLFNTNYQALTPVRKEFESRRRDKSRRITLGGSQGDSLRHEVNQALRASGYSVNPTPPEGTPV